MVQGWATLAIAIPVLVSAAVDYSFPDLDPYCAKFADMTTCTTGIGCTFTNGACEFDRAMACTPRLGPGFQKAIQDTMSCGATAANKCPDSCEGPAAQMYAYMRIYLNITSTAGYNDVLFAVQGLKDPQKQQFLADTSLCTAALTTYVSYKVSQWDPTYCMPTAAQIQAANADASASVNANSNGNSNGSGGAHSSGAVAVHVLYSLCWAVVMLFVFRTFDV